MRPELGLTQYLHHIVSFVWDAARLWKYVLLRSCGFDLSHSISQSICGVMTAHQVVLFTYFESHGITVRILEPQNLRYFMLKGTWTP